MRKVIVSAALAIAPVLAWAACTSHTYNYGRKYVYCTTCCYFGQCTTTCN